ncbi:MAG TPA: hypothetical protein PK283_00045 [Thiotrichales bacterium]|nr:hypothetical protein [Gammaproteobacteria bacterium]UCG19347.1 MAG: hypothetical protein JSU84_03845 [Thiotrichales bacterium]HQR81277.1 hypothetical protein [Thiotrichales bacterium]HQR94968.1 hypothetical protein [Thiotrichales bacterium]HQT05224.1 hypothetical protein [Thiotrichales bacterium]
MLDFLFFDATLAQRFAQQAQRLGGEVKVETVEAGEAGVQVRVRQASLSESAISQLDEVYDQLFFVEQAELIEAGGSVADACGVQLQLSSGDFTTVMMPPEEMNRLLSVFSPEEVQALFARIADAVEHPEQHQCDVCHVMKDGFIEKLRVSEIATNPNLTNL